MQAGIIVAKNIGTEVYNRLPENQTFNIIKQNDNYENAVNIGVGAVKGGANIIGGAFNGIVNVANSFGIAT